MHSFCIFCRCLCVFPRLFSSKIFICKKETPTTTAPPEIAWEATRDHCQDFGIGCSGTFHGSIRQGWGISSCFGKLGWTIGTLGRWRWLEPTAITQITHKEKGKMIDSPNLHEEMFQPLIFRGVKKYQSNIPILEWWDIFLYTLPGSLAVCPLQKSQ